MCLSDVVGNGKQFLVDMTCHIGLLALGLVMEPETIQNLWQISNVAAFKHAHIKHPVPIELPCGVSPANGMVGGSAKQGT